MKSESRDSGFFLSVRKVFYFFLARLNYVLTYFLADLSPSIYYYSHQVCSSQCDTRRRQIKIHYWISVGPAHTGKSKTRETSPHGAIERYGKNPCDAM